MIEDGIQAVCNPHKCLPTSNHLLPSAAILLPVFFCLELWWLDCAHFQVLAGDDLRGFPAALQGFASYNSLLTAALRFRPVTALLIWISAILSGGRYSDLVMLGAALHILNAFLFFCLLARLLKVSLGFSVGLTVVATFNRFTAYLIAPELALMEGAAITCYLLFLGALLRLIETARIRWAVLASLSFSIVLHIHERYVVLAGACLLVAALVYRRNRPASYLTCGCTVAALTFNVVAKKLLLHLPILVGTNTAAIEFNPKVILAFFADGLMNLGGVNRGPSHLSVLDYAAAPKWLKLLSLISLVLGLLLCSGAAYYSYKAIPSAGLRAKRGWMLVLLLCLVLALVMSASVTFRQEYRWLYPAYLTFLILLGLGARVCGPSFKWPIAQVALAGFLLLAIPAELYIRQHRDNFYARRACRVANDLYTLIQQSPELMGRREVVIGGDEVLFVDWMLLGDAFERFYHLPTLVFAPSASARLSASEGPPSILYHRAGDTFSLPPADGKEHGGRPGSSGNPRSPN